MTTTLGVDRNGSAVAVGDRVRLLEIRPSILKRLAGREQVDVSSMLGQVLEVFDVYDDGAGLGQPLVAGAVMGKPSFTAIAVDSHAIELTAEA
jgi:hypothetical protein